MHMAQKLSLLGHFLCVISYTRELLIPLSALLSLTVFSSTQPVFRIHCAVFSCDCPVASGNVATTSAILTFQAERGKALPN